MTHAIATTQLKNDAKNRALRTFVQGLAFDILVAIAVATAAWLPAADLTSNQAWGVLGFTLLKTVIHTATAYIMRLKLDSSRVPTPRPPVELAPAQYDWSQTEQQFRGNPPGDGTKR